MINNNLLELCLSPDLGGLELYMVRSAKALAESMNVISVINTDTKLEQYYENSNHKYEKIKRKRSFSFSTAKKLAKIIDTNNIDVIHMHWTKDLPIAVMAKVLSKKKPKLVQTRNMTMTRFKDDFYHRFLYKQMDLILPVTHQVAQQIQKFIPESIRPKVEVLYMGSDKPEILDEKDISLYKEEIGIKNNDFVVGMVGRIEEIKGQYLLIEAIDILKRDGIDIRAYIVGHAMHESYYKKLEEIVKVKGLNKAINFLGFTKKPHRFMQACDALVLATECETFGLVVIEAMQVGKVVIATNKCGPLEIIEHEKTGLLFENKSAESLAQEIKKLYTDNTLKSKLETMGKKSADDRFSNSKQFKKLLEILLHLQKNEK